jgi:signal transduction histidine kinase
MTQLYKRGLRSLSFHQHTGKQDQKGHKPADRELKRSCGSLQDLSHEIRTPLARIIGLAELLSLEDLGSDINPSVLMILDSSRRLLEVLNNMLETASSNGGALQLECREFPVHALVCDTARLIWTEAHKKALSVTAYCDEDIPEFVLGDESGVRQVLLNLGINAVKFTKKGEVHFHSQLREWTGSAMSVRFSVSDTGVGIAPDRQKKLFQPAAAGKADALKGGLGLTVSKKLVELMGGKIGIKSEPGKGSTFWFDIPFPNGVCRA